MRYPFHVVLKGRSRIAGAKGIRRRWAKATPEQRAAAARAMNEGRLARYTDRARAQLALAGHIPTDKELRRAAEALWQADLADRRYLAWLKRQPTFSPKKTSGWGLMDDIEADGGES